VKIDRHGQARVLTQSEIRLLFSEGLQTDHDRALVGVCLYTAAPIAEACTLRIADAYTPEGEVRSDLIFRKANTKGKLATRCIPVIEDLRVLLVRYHPTPGQPYLFPGKPYNTRLGHITSDAAGLILRQAFKRVGIEGASSHSFRRTALTQMSNAGWHLLKNRAGSERTQEFRTVAKVSGSQAGTGQRSCGQSLYVESWQHRNISISRSKARVGNFGGIFFGSNDRVGYKWRLLSGHQRNLRFCLSAGLSSVLLAGSISFDT
jgi:integrase/recombinase XerD